MSVPTPREARDELRFAVRQCLERHADVRAFVPEPGGTGASLDHGLHRRLSEEMGLAGLIVPEQLGGSGAGIAELATAFEELGATLAPVALYATAGLAVPALLTVGGFGADPKAAELLAAIAEGGTVATLAFAETPGRFAPGESTVAATRSGGGWTVSGTKQFVVDGDSADLLLVTANTDAGLGLFAVDRSAAGVTVASMRGIDLLRGLAEIRLEDAPAALIGGDADTAAALATALDLAVVLLAVEQVGGAQRCLDNAVAYAKERVQFDRPIGSFQAIKHLLVDLLLEVELARSAMTHAVAAADEYLLDPGPATAESLAEAASLARSVCSETFMHVADETLHVHGGIGFTWEHDSHLYFRRAKSSELLFGNPYEHRERLAAVAGLGVARSGHE